MLTTYIHNSKCILITDTYEVTGKSFLKFIINEHLKTAKYPIHYFMFEGPFESTKRLYDNSQIVFHDFSSDIRGWIFPDNSTNLKDVILKLSGRTVVVFNSLAHAINQHGVGNVYKIVHELVKANADIQQVVLLLHKDILLDQTTTMAIFQHISTLHINLIFTENLNLNRCSYLYKKPGGKMIKQIEEYKFDNGVLTSSPIKKIDPKLALKAAAHDVLPDQLTTFRISLDDREKQSREKLVLPYLPKTSGDSNESSGNVFYQLDHNDDWDEEDPDDDLDL